MKNNKDNKDNFLVSDTSNYKTYINNNIAYTANVPNYICKTGTFNTYNAYYTQLNFSNLTTVVNGTNIYKIRSNYTELDSPVPFNSSTNINTSKLIDFSSSFPLTLPDLKGLNTLEDFASILKFDISTSNVYRNDYDNKNYIIFKPYISGISKDTEGTKLIIRDLLIDNS